MALSYASNIQKNYQSCFLFQKCNLQLVTLCLYTIVSYTMIIISRDAVLGSTFWFFSVI